jgi:outer membrane protein
VSQDFNGALSVKRQYYAVLASQEALAAAERQLEQADQQLKISTIRMRAGAVARTDSLRSAITVGNAKLAVLAARTGLEIANAALTRLAGTPFEVTAIAADTADTPHVELDRAALIAMAIDGPSTRAASAQLSASRSSRRAAWTPYLPTLSMSYAWGTNRSSKEFEWGGPGRAQSSSLGFSASYTVFGGYQREARAVSAAVAEDNAEAGLRDALAAARESAIQYLSAFRAAEETIALQQLTVAAAEEDLRTQQQRYALGGAALVDLLTAQTTLANARSALIAARFQARAAKAQIEALVGRELK